MVAKRKRYGAEEIIGKLREAEIGLTQGQSVGLNFQCHGQHAAGAFPDDLAGPTKQVRAGGGVGLYTSQKPFSCPPVSRIEMHAGAIIRRQSSAVAIGCKPGAVWWIRPIQLIHRSQRDLASGAANISRN